MPGKTPPNAPAPPSPPSAFRPNPSPPDPTTAPNSKPGSPPAPKVRIRRPPPPPPPPPSRGPPPPPPPPLWIVYIGHGTHDTRETRLNLRGPDVTAKELAAWLAPLTRPLIFIHGGSAGAPFINALSGPDRIIVSATRSGSELNYARFGERFADAVANPAADIDQDGQTSLLEAFVTAAQQVQSFYAETGRLATEHALIDDNGDKQGTPAEWFRGTRVQRRPQDSTAQPDGQHARLLALIPTEAERALTPAQREQRDALERELEVLRAKKPSLPEDDYYRQLESLFRRLGALYRRDS